MLVAKVPEGGRPLPKVCLKEANFAWAVLGGVEGWLGSAELRGVIEAVFRGGVAGERVFMAGGFFLLD